jgi:hypothetical protein
MAPDPQSPHASGSEEPLTCFDPRRDQSSRPAAAPSRSRERQGNVQNRRVAEENELAGHKPSQGYLCR